MSASDDEYRVFRREAIEEAPVDVVDRFYRYAEPVVGCKVLSPEEWGGFYEAFKAELDKVTIKADAPAAAVVGECLRAAKRAQIVLNGGTVSPGPFVCERA